MSEPEFNPAPASEVTRHMATIRKISEEWARLYMAEMAKFTKALNGSARKKP